MCLFTAVVLAFLIYYVVSGRAAWLFSAICSLPFLVCTSIWFLVVALVLTAEGWSPVLFAFAIMLALVTIALVIAGRGREGGSRRAESPPPSEPEPGNEELLVEAPVEPEKDALIRAWAKERSELCGKKPISAASPAEREKNRLLGDICTERLKWLAQKKDTP